MQDKGLKTFKTIELGSKTPVIFRIVYMRCVLGYNTLHNVDYQSMAIKKNL